MKKIMLTLLVVGFALALAIPKTFRAQTSSASHLPRGTATDINNSEIDALVGQRKRSAFLAEVAAREVRRRRLLALLDKETPLWDPAEHPNIEEAGGAAA